MVASADWIRLARDSCAEQAALSSSKPRPSRPLTLTCEFLRRSQVLHHSRALEPVRKSLSATLSTGEFPLLKSRWHWQASGRAVLPQFGLVSFSNNSLPSLLCVVPLPGPKLLIIHRVDYNHLRKLPLEAPVDLQSSTLLGSFSKLVTNLRLSNVASILAQTLPFLPIR